MQRKKTIRLRLLTVVLSLMMLGAGYYLSTVAYMVSYRTIHQGAVGDFIEGGDSNGNISYLKMVGYSPIFILHERDLTPQFDFHVLENSATTLTYRTDLTSFVDVTGTNGLTLQGTAYDVVALSTTAPARAYTTSLYRQHPNGFSIDLHPYGIGVLGAGIGTLALSLFLGEWLFSLIISIISGGALAILIAMIVRLILQGFSLSSLSSIASVTPEELKVALIFAGVGSMVGAVVGIVLMFGHYQEVHATQGTPEYRAQRVAARAVLKRQPQSALDWRNRGNALDFFEQFNKAIAAYDNAMRLTPSTSPLIWVLWYDKGIVYNRAAKYQEAVTCLQKSLAIAPGQRPVLHTLGVAFLNMGNSKAADDIYTQILAQAPDDVGALINKSAALARMGKRDESLTYCRRALELDPKNVVALKNQAALTGENRVEIPEGLFEVVNDVLDGISEMHSR